MHFAYKFLEDICKTITGKGLQSF